MNTFVTMAHVSLVLIFTVIAFMSYNLTHFNGVDGYTVAAYRLYTAWIFFGGLQDIFLAIIMFFILDEATPPSIIRDEERHISYPVLEVIKTDSSHESFDESN